MKTEEYDLLLKRREMSKESWIKNVMRIHPDKTREETEALWQKIFEADEVARLVAPEQQKPKMKTKDELIAEIRAGKLAIENDCGPQQMKKLLEYFWPADDRESNGESSVYRKSTINSSCWYACESSLLPTIKATNFIAMMEQKDDQILFTNAVDPFTKGSNNREQKDINVTQLKEEKHTDEMTNPIEFVQRRINQAFKAEQNSGAEYYPFDSMTLKEIPGMRRAYQDVLRFLNGLKPEPVSSDTQEELTLKDKIEWVKKAFQLYVGFENTQPFELFLKESNFTITLKP